MKYIRITFSCESSLHAAVKAAARANDTDLSHVLRAAMREYLAAHRQPDLPLAVGRPRKVGKLAEGRALTAMIERGPRI